MAIDDNEALVVARQLRNDTSSNVEVGRNRTLKAILSVSVPILGSVISDLLGDIAQNRWNARVAELMTLFAEKLEEVIDDVSDHSYYSSEEFQALLLEAVDQERTNRYKQKRAMLAQGLANSGSTPFIQDQSKELYFRIMRDLTPADISLLKSLYPQAIQHPLSKTPEKTIAPGRGDAIYNRLQGLGLLSSTLNLKPRSSPTREVNDLRDVVQHLNAIHTSSPNNIFSMSFFGRGFMAFLDTKPPD